MTAMEIEERIRTALENERVGVDEIIIQQDPYSGWRIAIVAPGFESISPDRRRELVVSALPGVTLQWLDVITPDERIWAGTLPNTVEPAQLPLWPESLARANRPMPRPTFPSDLDEDLTPPIVATFYSLRGGVGRSTALAHTAQILASTGSKVVCVDLDLEAPGLAALFGKESEVSADQGVVNLLLSLEQGEDPDISKHLIRITDSYDLYCLPAGLPDANYARQLSLLDPEAWYREERNPLRELVRRLGENLPFRPDVILLDSRTGITPMNGPLLFDLADIACVVFFPHPQTEVGTAALVRALLASHTRRTVTGGPLAPEPRFIVSPIPASKAPEVVQRYRHRAAEWIHRWLSHVTEKDNRWIESDITQFIPYQESIATSDAVFFDAEVSALYAPISDWIRRFLPSPTETQSRPTVANLKSSALEELEFPGATAEEQEKNNLLETFVKTDFVNRATSSSVPVVIGRKGTGKTALFRWLVDRSPGAIVLLAPAKLREEWQPSVDGFKAAAEMLKKRDGEWREFWLVYSCLACHRQLDEQSRIGLVPSALRDALSNVIANESDTITAIERILTVPGGSLQAGEWLKSLDATIGTERLILVDGLDSGFGSSATERDRRTQAVEGLFIFLTDRAERLKHLRFKILLREDIWRKLRFENKSHLFGRSVRLAWDNQADYLTIILRQALRSKTFVDLVGHDDEARVVGEQERADAVYRMWSMLVGERMKGGNTTYTANWVWNRLADANNDRGPRALLQLFQNASVWERREHRTTPYERSILRPRALIASLDTVSGEALGALLEEFPELEPMRQKLSELEKTPVWAEELSGLRDTVALAREVGLVSVYEGTESEPIRYRVPDIYRIGLHMTRMGQL